MTRQLLHLRRALIALSAFALVGLSACSDDGEPGASSNSNAQQDAGEDTTGSEDASSQDTTPTDTSSTDADEDAGSEDASSQDTTPTDTGSADAGEDADDQQCEDQDPSYDCSQDGCEEGLTCILAEDACIPSHCSCDGGQWICSSDCSVGAHVCVEDPDFCADENLPSKDCRDYGCEDKETCAPADGCLASSCVCDPVEQTIGCTSDCGERYECVADTGKTCDEPNPAGCTQEGCPSGETCQTDPNECAPSECNCSDGQWVCSRDCGGGGTCK